MQTLGAIINSTCAKQDYCGHITDDELILITNTIQAEKIASFLAFAFDNILNKFYSNDEFENNFTVLNDDNVKEIKTGLMRLNISAIEKNKNKPDVQIVLNSLYDLIERCVNEDTSSYIIDRIKLEGQSAKKESKVLIFEPDDALSYLLKNVCEMNGILAQIVQDENEFIEEYQTFKPNVVLLDWGNKETSKSYSIAKEISKDNVKLIFSSSYLNKKEILKAGADLYIPKPYEIDDMFYWIKKFLK